MPIFKSNHVDHLIFVCSLQPCSDFFKAKCQTLLGGNNNVRLEKSNFFSVFRTDPFTATKTFKASNAPQMFQICIDITVKLQGQTVSSSLEFSYQGKAFKMFSNHLQSLIKYNQTPYFSIFLFKILLFMQHTTKLNIWRKMKELFYKSQKKKSLAVTSNQILPGSVFLFVMSLYHIVVTHCRSLNIVLLGVVRG